MLSDVNIFDTHDAYDFDFIKNLSQVISKFDNLNSQPSICIFLDRGALYIATVLAAWRAGFYVVPLNTSWPLVKNVEIINRIKPNLIIVEDEMEISSPNCPILSRSSLVDQCQHLDDLTVPARALKSHDIAYVIFTSGSTGEPKGVIISAGSYKAYIDWTARHFKDYSEIQKLLLTSELTFDITMGDIAFALAFGTDIGVAKQHKNIPSVLAMIMKYNIELLYSVPTTHLALINFAKNKKGADLSSLKLIMSGGDRFPWQMVKDYKVLTNGAHFFNVYGPTEVTINCFSIRLDDKIETLSKKDKPVPIGNCFDSLDYILLNDQEISNEQGELCILGSQIMMGYHSDSKKTGENITSDPSILYTEKLIYRTGDIAYVEDGLVFLKGRLDNLVKIKGYRIHPDEVAKAIDSIDGIDSSAVIALNDMNDEYRLVAYIKRKKDINLTSENLNKSLLLKLPAYMIPSEYNFVEDFPLNQSGKIDTQKLKENNK